MPLCIVLLFITEKVLDKTQTPTYVKSAFVPLTILESMKYSQMLKDINHPSSVSGLMSFKEFICYDCFILFISIIETTIPSFNTVDQHSRSWVDHDLNQELSSAYNE